MGEAGEMMRLTAIASDADNPNMNNGILRYQYRVRKVAYLDSEGKLVKTAAWDDFKKYVDMPLKYDPCCCGYCWCLSRSSSHSKTSRCCPPKMQSDLQCPRRVQYEQNIFQQNS